MTCDAKDERDDVVKDSGSTSQDISMGAVQTGDLPRGSTTSRQECQFHLDVRTKNHPYPSLHCHSPCSLPWLQTTSHSHAEPFGCPLLLSIHYHIEAYPTTGGAYLDTIFTHRALLHASPRGHEGCARAFSDLARKIDDREWRADRESDQEAVAAFLNEAMTVATSY